MTWRLLCVRLPQTCLDPCEPLGVLTLASLGECAHVILAEEYTHLQGSRASLEQSVLPQHTKQHERGAASSNKSGLLLPMMQDIVILGAMSGVAAESAHTLLQARSVRCVGVVGTSL